MKAQVVNVSPEIAKQLLSKSTINRPLRKDVVAFYAHEMINGRWQLNPADAIVIFKNGRLGNAHHRLAALIKSGMTLPFLVATDCDEETYKIMDQGKKRTPGDVFAIKGIPDYNNKSSMIGRYFNIRKDKALTLLSKEQAHYGRDKISASAMLEFYINNTDLVDTIAKTSSKQYDKFRHLKRSWIGGTTLYLTIDKMHDLNYVIDFFDQLTSGRDVKNKTIYVFRDFLINESETHLRSSSAYRTAIFHRTWNYYVLNKNVSRFSAIDIDNIPELI